MDLGQIETVVAQSEQVATITVFQPNDEPYRGSDGKESTLSFTGSESRAFRAARDSVTRRVLRSRKTRLEADDIERNRIDLAASVVTAWSGWEIGGKPAPCTPENVKALLKVEHILVQLEGAINGHADFFGKS